MADYNINNTNSKTIIKKFGRPEDYIELHIYNSDNQILLSEISFKDYTQPSPLSDTINLDPEKILLDRGFSSGQYILKFNILRNKVFNSDEYSFSIREISNNRREIKSVAPSINNQTLSPSVSSLISEIESSAYFKEYSLNLGNDILIPIINVLYNKEPLKHELLLKTLNPLSPNIRLNSSFKIVEEIVNSITTEVDLGNPELIDDSIELTGPNFNIDIKLNQSIPSNFKTYDDILNYNVTSSYQHLLNKLEQDDLDLNIQYDYIRPISGNLETSYHFENFVHFGSALEQVKNFEYKLKLIELYDSQISDIDSIPSPSTFDLTNKNNINTKKENLFKGFSGYEQFLYFESGAYSWPKSNSVKPYTLHTVSSTQAKTWLGNENSAFPTYGGQLLSASLFDKQNEYNLNRLVPTHILDNLDNQLYVTFINMLGQHFDHIWTYIRHLTEVNNNNNKTGISKDLVYYQLKSLGIDAFDQFENSNLIEYILGEGTGSGQYDVTHFISSSGVPSETMVTASNAGSIPKQDISKEIWKRLYHNAPYLLKTKGTERGIKALMSCYGIPSTILNIKEYGGSTTTSGPIKDLDLEDYYKTFTYEKSSLALKTTSSISDGDYMVRFPWSGSNVGERTSKSIELRIKPIKGNEGIALSLGATPANATGLQLVLDKHTGNDISSSNDSTDYGKLLLKQAGNIRASSSLFPLYNGDFWNIHLMGVSSSNEVFFGAYQTNYLKNTLKFTGSWDSNDYDVTFGSGSTEGGAYVFAGTNGYHGSIQELKCNWGEKLTDSTLTKHSLEPFMYSGNTISSSFSNTIIRLPLGSNDKEDLQNSPPDVSLTLSNRGAASTMVTGSVWEETTEFHHLPTPDTVGISTTSEKVRIDEGTIDNNILDPFKKFETSTLDRQPQDFEDLGVFFSPTNEINEDILYTLGSFRLDDYIGSPLPSAQTSSQYEDLKTIKDIYFQKVERRYNYWDYIKTIQYMDHTLFKIIEQFVPFKANLKTGLLIEPHFLERTKFQRELPSRSDGQTMVIGSHQTIELEIIKDYNSGSLYSLSNSSFVAGNNLSTATSSKGVRKETGTNGTIDIYDDYLDPFNRDPESENNHSHQGPIIPNSTGSGVVRRKKSNTLLGTATRGKTSNRYYKYAEYPLVSSSLY